jgi:D-alanyl-lipoteichoic acid acyltransferase DltB (MBOAT superfamily)
LASAEDCDVASIEGDTVLLGLGYVGAFLACIGVFVLTRRIAIRQATLLAASYGLYFAWQREMTSILVLSTVMNFLFGKALRRRPSGWLLTTGIICNVALLGAFKYLPEIANRSSSATLHLATAILLPLGISFWTFQAMSYLFDQYRGEELEPTFPEFALFMAFFPVTISGPICRLGDMLPQFRSDQTLTWTNIGTGARRVAAGILMMQLAKLLGQGILAGDGVNSGFDRAAHLSGPDVWCLVFGFGLQLFFDFAGYSSIAIGAAQALGVVVPENFDRPFSSTTPSIFWTRWHMSLSFWIRDYVFLPLATLRREVWWRCLTLVMAMVLFGLWHRASMLFVLWGCYHGAVLVGHRIAQGFRRNRGWDDSSPLWRIGAWALTMALINLGWIYFRADSPQRAGQMFAAVLSPASYASHELSLSLYALVAALALGYAATARLSDILERHESEARPGGIDSQWISALARWRWYWIPPLYALTLILVLLVTFTQGASTSQFMYSQF